MNNYQRKIVLSIGSLFVFSPIIVLSLLWPINVCIGFWRTFICITPWKKNQWSWVSADWNLFLNAWNSHNFIKLLAFQHLVFLLILRIVLIISVSIKNEKHSAQTREMATWMIKLHWGSVKSISRVCTEPLILFWWLKNVVFIQGLSERENKFVCVVFKWIPDVFQKKRSIIKCLTFNGKK